MAIWEHPTEGSAFEWLKQVAYITSCAFCNEPLDLTSKTNRDGDEYPTRCFVNTEIRVCPVCGWWKVFEKIHDVSDSHDPYDADITTYNVAAGILKRFKHLGLETPIEELRAYLAARPKRRFDIHPERIEKVVCSVFQSCGYHVEERQYSKDGGIDAIIFRDNGDPVPIQVKAPRSPKKVQVSVIREFLGAMLIDAHKKDIAYTKGSFVTMAEFTKGAQDAAKFSPIDLELFDAARFFDILRIAQREDYVQEDLETMIQDARTTQIWTSIF